MAMLTVDHIGKSFGGLRVLSDVTFDVNEGEVVGLIGPNGAGKTTLFNVITGFLTPNHGTVMFDGRDITRLAPNARVRAGLVRTFQKSMVFPDLSLRENIALAVRARNSAGYRLRPAARELAEADATADALLARARLGERAGDKVCNLSYGDQRIVDVLISLAMAPRLLLLDEPTAGLAREEGERLIEIVRQHDSRTAIVLIAHDLDIVFGTSNRVAVLDLGRMIAFDTPAAIRAHAGARAAYLGALAEAT
ncbi:ABC transporter ATP-binding protein [Bradyrhizobium sp. U87765 SZCCT0131]|uniref:ABC transporter ATP-binding protein n=1 Tax=unclassified Bradyrhizobium TaxID=2631580 RepID=UPI001BABF651|nr:MULTISPECIES: ABC transporter ATP-binding protein [unclassified Bradyrhizobium]MBR1219795.1 ABC transporter ATP-binding protein [Bradyrhizobium sp. U87765 SZCCT0131]MBR1262446.1 ABC transporter ATP-binding protein [Bradyrhizobium sp. U87765 SZCCT0134]MBR1308371.1 ABC transporter ATP-binding protein [Bradyrhizobium sp. U87765 SZCCT0110]MBR1318228.1 ABC transporter ATP-binding protein [Bradyrhizobium sp. U87765 SZCCT0109]MBR1351931.1 ABC transporter ATP-binding protein [Bradyrhizobium sp. U87